MAIVDSGVRLSIVDSGVRLSIVDSGDNRVVSIV